MNQSSDRALSDFSLKGLDLALLVLGFAGFVSFGILLPDQHPDSSAAFEISSSEAINRANIFLSSQGLHLEGLVVDAHLVRNQELLTDLQRLLGRPTAVRFLESENRNQFAAFYWRISYKAPPLDRDGSFFSNPQLLFEVGLSQDGSVLSFENNSRDLGASARRYGSPLEKINRSALASIIRADTASDIQARQALQIISDSTFASYLKFDLEGLNTQSSEDFLSALISNQTVIFDSSEIIQLLDYHLSRTVFGSISWKIDSLSIRNTGLIQVARVLLLTDPPIAGQQISLGFTLSATGTLAALDVTYNPDRYDKSDVSNILDIIRVALLALFAFVFIVVFFRRAMARLLDVKSALVDAMVLGILQGIFVILFTWNFSEAMNSAPLWGVVLLNLILFSLTAGAIAVFVFMIAGVTDSVVRESYAEKLSTLTLLRHGDFQNRPMGASLLRGISLAGILLGVSIVAFLLFPDLHIASEELLSNDRSIRPVIGYAFSAFPAAYFYTFLWMVGIGTLAYRFSASPGFLILLVTATGALIQIGPLTIDSGYTALAVSAVFSLILALSFVRHDILTVMIAIFVARLLWRLSEGFLISGTPGWIDLMLAGIFIGSLIVLGILGITSKRTPHDVDIYVPEYITEMASQERIKRELEIARQVQTFFLPGKMPEVQSLDLAGMCLSATEVGGDYYDFIELDDGRMAFILGDVSGKGIQAAFFMTLVKGIIQTLSQLDYSSVDVMRKLNHLFYRNAPPGTFMSVIYGVFDPFEKTFAFARAGHNPPIFYRAAQSSAVGLRPRGMAVGFTDSKKFDPNIEGFTVQLMVGDSIVFYTDGFSEAMNRSRELYGDDRLVAKVSQIGNKSASDILRLMTEDVHHFIEGMGRTDDMTMVVMKLKAS